MSDTPSPRADRWLFTGWAVFAAANSILMFAMPGTETVPFHFVWISLAIVYGWRPWTPARTSIVLAVVCGVTGTALVKHVHNGVIGWEETTEVPLMSLVFLAMVWHVRRRTTAVLEARQFAESESRLREGQRRFVRFAAHALRAPVTVARGYTELICEDHGDSRVGEDTAIVLDELDKLDKIAARLLTLAQMDEPSPLRLGSIDLDVLLERTIRRWRLAARRRWLVDTRAGVIFADPERLETALDNLLDNAVRYTEEDGTIALSCRRRDGTAVIEVRDDGIGIPAGEVAFVFESFRSGTVRGGTGMGLAVVKAVVEAHGGQVAAETPLAGGAVFTMRLPAGRRTAAMEPNQAPQMAEEASGGVLEDMPAMAARVIPPPPRWQLTSNS
jgi:two-component system OmpR family sensor kinase